MQWFKHLSKLRNDVRIDRVIAKFGLEGYGLYVLVLECISDRLTSSDPMPDLEETSEDLARKYKVDTLKAEKILLFCIEQGLFEYDKISGRIVCHKIYKFLDTSMTGSPELRKMIKKYKESHGVRIDHDMSGDVRTEENKKEENRIEKKRKENLKGEKNEEVNLEDILIPEDENERTICEELLNKKEHFMKIAKAVRESEFATKASLYILTEYLRCKFKILGAYTKQEKQLEYLQKFHKALEKYSYRTILYAIYQIVRTEEFKKFFGFSDVTFNKVVEEAQAETDNQTSNINPKIFDPKIQKWVLLKTGETSQQYRERIHKNKFKKIGDL